GRSSAEPLQSVTMRPIRASVGRDFHDSGIASAVGLETSTTCGLRITSNTIAAAATSDDVPAIAHGTQRRLIGITGAPARLVAALPPPIACRSASSTTERVLLGARSSSP